MRSAVYATVCVALLAASPAWALDSGRFGNQFLNTEPLRVNLSSADVKWVRLLNSQGRNLKQISLKAGTTAADFGIRPPGYYQIQTKGGASLPVVVLVNPAMRVPGESRLATDNAMSNVADPAHFDDIARLLKLTGIGWVRERLAWFQLEPARDLYNWDVPSDDAVNALSAQELQISEVFHATPAWARSDQNFRRAPDDLRDIYNFARTLAENYQGRVQAWEAWNEPDLSFFDDSASEMAAYQKAAYLGFHAADASTRVLSPSIGVAPGAFAEHLLQNGMGPYFDIWNYHLYDEPTQYAARVQEHRDLLSRYELGDRPMWVTEAGVPAGDTGQVSVSSRWAQSVFLSRSLASALATGVDRHFWFLFGYLQFGLTDWGLLAPDGQTPLPALAALSTATYALGHANYLGRFTGLPTDITALVFDRGNDTQALVLWNNSTSRKRITMPLQWGMVLEAMDHLGTPLRRGSDKNVLSLVRSDAATYLIVPAGTLDSWLTDQPAPPATPVPVVSPSLVVRLRITNATLQRWQDTYAISAGTTYDLIAEVYNFGNAPQTVFMGCDGTAAAFLSQQVIQVVVPAGGRVQWPLTLNINGPYAGGGLRLVAGNGSVTSSNAVLSLELASP